ncbi:P-loop containing nucleoside triphosphate hydrolase protein [Aspergillus venezuelensis]
MATEIPNDEIDAFEAHIAPDIALREQPSFPAVLAIFNPKDEELESTIGAWQGREPSVKIHLEATLQEAFESFLRIRLCIRYRDATSEDILCDHGDIYLTAAHIDTFRLTKLVPPDTKLQESEAYIPASLYSICEGSETWGTAGLLWQMDVTLLSHQFHESNVFSPRTFGDQTVLMDRIRTHLRQTKCLSFYLVAEDPTPSMTLLNGHLKQDSTRSPLDVWYPKHPNSHFLQLGDYPGPDERPSTKYHLKYSFRTWSEYQTIMGYGVIYEHENRLRTIQALEDQVLSLRVMSIPDAMNRRYLAFLELPPADQSDIVELYPDDRVKVTFNIDANEAHPDSDWFATVANPIVTTPPGHVPMWLTRRWDSEHGYHQLDPELQPVDVLSMTDPRAAHHALCQQQARKVRVQVIDSTRPFQAKISSLRNMQLHPPANRALLLSNHLADQPRVNLFAGLDEQADELVKTFNFNDEQMEGFQMLKRLVHGMGVIHGPPGTGKTFWLLRVLLPLLLPKPSEPDQRRQVMILGPSNNVVDAIAGNMHTLISQHDAPESDLVVTRLHSLTTEEELSREPANRNRPPSATDRPAIIQASAESVILEDMTTASLVASLHQRHAALPAGVSDRRVTQVELSLGYRMLQLAGIISASWSQPNNFQEVRQMWVLWQSGVEFEEEQYHRFTALIRDLRDCMLQRTDVVVCTPFTTSEQPVYLNVHPHVIVVDEAGQLHDSDLWPALSYYNPVGFLLVGDHKQLRPLVFSDTKSNPFADQLRLSLFGRMKINGLMDIMFREQRRMVNTLCGLVSSVFYQSSLKTSPHLPEAVVEASRQLTRYIKQPPFRKQHPLTFLDIGPCEEKRDARGRSTLNIKSCAAVFALVKDLIANAGVRADQITILTPYRGQLYLYHTLLSMHDSVRQTRVYTVDSFQGSESIVVIFDVTASSRPRFLGNANRLNVALSRARSAMFLVGDWKQLLRPETGHSRSDKAKAKMLKAVVTYILQHKLRAPLPKSFTAAIDEAKDYLEGFAHAHPGDHTASATDADNKEATSSGRVADGWTSTADATDESPSVSANADTEPAAASEEPSFAPASPESQSTAGHDEQSSAATDTDAQPAAASKAPSPDPAEAIVNALLQILAERH